MEIGIANYFFDIPQGGLTSLATMSDISFGLERLVWAINKTESYFYAIGPLPHTFLTDTRQLDSVRTLTLMASSGVTPGVRNHGSKFRRLMQSLVNPFGILPLMELVNFYYKQWGDFQELPISWQRTYSIISKELERQTNIRTNQLLEGEIPKKLQEESIEGLIKEDTNLLDKFRNKLVGAKK